MSGDNTVDRTFGNSPRPLFCSNYDGYVQRSAKGFADLSRFLPDRSNNSNTNSYSQLRKVLGPQPQTPISVPNPWNAHHIIPTGAKKARVARALSFRCRLHPNEGENGIYLRASGLARRTKTGKRNVAYELLKRQSPNLAKRTYHGDTLRNVYYDDINEQMGPRSPGGSGPIVSDTCNSSRRTAAVSALADLKRGLLRGKVYGRPQR